MTERVCVILLAATDAQNVYFWNSYNECTPGASHDLIVVHRNGMFLPSNIKNKFGEVIFFNKINQKGEDIPHRAFGAYRHYFNLLKNNYDYFIFVSDDVVIRRDSWIKNILHDLNIHDKCGFGASQVFNGGKRYPHESHIRAPFWFAKTQYLNKIHWDFSSDHDGEMKIGMQLYSQSECFGVQVGNKLDLAYDSGELNHITQLIEKEYFSSKNLKNKFADNEIDYFKDKINLLNNAEIVSPFSHIGKMRVLHDIEPFAGLLFRESVDLAKRFVKVKEILPNTFVIEN